MITHIDLLDEFNALLLHSEHGDALDHSGQNEHEIDCYCDLCYPQYQIGFYTCTCDQCDPEANCEAHGKHETRHDIVCGCALGPIKCEKYPHVLLDERGLWGQSGCDCRDCMDDPILACNDGCPICSHDSFVTHMRERYESSLSQNEQPEVLEVRETKLFKYEIHQWRKPAGIWVAAIPKVEPLEPVIEYACLDVADAKKCIQDLIKDSKSAATIQPPKITMVPTDVESKTYLPDLEKAQLDAFRSWSYLKSMTVGVAEWPVFWEDYKVVYLSCYGST